MMEALSRKILINNVLIEKNQNLLLELSYKLKTSTETLILIKEDILNQQGRLKEIIEDLDEKQVLTLEYQRQLDKIKSESNDKFTNQCQLSSSTTLEEPVIIKDEPKNTSNAHLIKTLNKWLVEDHWPYMRVKNTIKQLNLGTTKISHYDGLILLAKYANLGINDFIAMDYDTFRNKYKIMKYNKYTMFYANYPLLM